MQEATPAAPKRTVIRIRLWPELALLALMLMELTLITAYYEGLSSYRIAWPEVAVVLGGIILISHYGMRVLGVVTLSTRARRILFASWLLLALFGSLKILVLPHQPVGLFTLLVHPFLSVVGDENNGFAEFFHLILAGILAWRGISLARTPISVGSVLRSFQIGLLVFLLYGLIIARQNSASGYVELFVFLFLAVIALASARIASTTELRGGKIGRFSREWVLGIIVSALLIVGIVMLLGLLLEIPVALVISRLFAFVFFLFSVVIMLLAYPIILLLSYLVPLIASLKGKIPGLEVLQELQALINQLANQEKLNVINLTGVLTAGRIIGRVLIFVGIVLVVVLALRWRPFARRETAEEEVSDLPGKFRWPALPALDPRKALGRLTNAGRWLAAQRIRRIYAELMQMCADAGHPRPEALTPLEFLPQMTDFLPGQEADLKEITGAYQSVRYGMLPETPEEVRATVQAWERVRTVGRKAVVEHKMRLKAEQLHASRMKQQ